MRYVYFLLLVAGLGILVLALQNSAEDMNSAWLSYEDAVKKSNETGKMLFIFISSPTCPTCAKFREFFSQEGVMDKISSNFLPVYIKDPAYSPVPVTAFPTFCVGYPNDLDCFYSSSGENLLKRLGVS
ncbi:MAG: thioredoxin family protein [Archaeoglobaceae archaeon]